MFADDTKVYREITDFENDTRALQTYIVRLANWATLWQLRFNPEKCETTRITHSCGRSVPSYTTGIKNYACQVYERSRSPSPASDLSWSAQVHAVVHKANRILGVIYRTLGPSNVEAFSTLYKSLVRPVLEYASPVWCPYLVKDMLALEKVQRRASRRALGQRRGDMEYEDRLKILKWPTLEKRRHYISLVECYKTVFGLNGLNFSDVFDLALDPRTRANHPFKLFVKSAKVNPYKYSFFVRIVKAWNNLPSHVVQAEAFDILKPG